MLVSLLNGESVLYDAVAIVLFTSLEKHIDEASPALLTMDVLGLFVLVFFGSFLFGVIAGALVAWCYHQAEYLSLFEDYEIGAMCLLRISHVCPRTVLWFVWDRVPLLL